MMNPLLNFNAPLPAAAVHVTAATSAQHNADASQRGGFASLLNLASAAPPKLPSPAAPAPAPASAVKAHEPAPHAAPAGDAGPTNETTQGQAKDEPTASAGEPQHPMARRATTAPGPKARPASAGKPESAATKAKVDGDSGITMAESNTPATDPVNDGTDPAGTIDPMVLLAAARAVAPDAAPITTSPGAALATDGQTLPGQGAGIDPAATAQPGTAPGTATGDAVANLAAAPAATAGTTRAALGLGSEDTPESRRGAIALDGIEPGTVRHATAAGPAAAIDPQAAPLIATNAGFQAASVGAVADTHRLQELDVVAAAQAAPVAAEGASPNAATAANGLSFAAGLADALAPKGAGHPPATVEVRVATPVNSPEFAPALGLTISTLAAGGVQEARLQLHPAELGPITVQIALDGTGARIDFQADVAQTRQAIEASLPALAGALQDAGLTLTGGGVSQQSHNASRDPSSSGQNSAGRAGHARDGLTGTDGAAAPVAARAAPARRSLIDLVA